MAELNRIPWWEWLPIFPWRIVAAVAAADEVPTTLPRNGVVLVGNHQHSKWLVFDCPCRTGHRIMINLDRANRPYWRLSGRYRISVEPSIDFKNAQRRCHYFIRNGKIAWAHDHRSR
jgi:hypothetical protein